MKATELMVGDWVFLPKENKPICVKSVHRTMIEPTPESDSDHFVIGDEYLEPIELTPEILKKNGFVEKDFYSELVYGEYRILSDATHLAIIHGEHADLDIPVYYVHEVQHAFRLCRKDIDFNP